MTQPTPPRIRVSRIFIEAVVIIGSILLAFAIDAWWQEREEREEEHRMLLAVYDEFQENKELLEEARAFHREVGATELELMALAAQPNPQISADSLDVLIGDMLWWWQPTKFSTGALQALTQGGRLHYILNEELRRELAGWDAEIETVHHDERQDYTTFHDDVMPFLREHVYFPQVSGKVTHKPGKTDPIAPLDVPLRPGSSDHRSLLAHPAFPNFLVQKWWVHWDALDVYDNFEMRSDEVLALLEEELRRWR